MLGRQRAAGQLAAAAAGQGDGIRAQQKEQWLIQGWQVRSGLGNVHVVLCSSHKRGKCVSLLRRAITIAASDQDYNRMKSVAVELALLLLTTS